jgi:hypothetical protein
MSQLTIEVETARGSMEEIRGPLDAALKEQFPGGMLKWQWDGEVLQLWGPGAKGTIVLEGGRLVGRAELHAPAALMRPVIEQKMTRAMQKGAA